VEIESPLYPFPLIGFKMFPQDAGNAIVHFLGTGIAHAIVQIEWVAQFAAEAALLGFYDLGTFAVWANRQPFVIVAADDVGNIVKRGLASLAQKVHSQASYFQAAEHGIDRNSYPAPQTPSRVPLERLQAQAAIPQDLRALAPKPCANDPR
jgi:hypothetical protein